MRRGFESGEGRERVSRRRKKEQEGQEEQHKDHDSNKHSSTLHSLPPLHVSNEEATLSCHAPRHRPLNDGGARGAPISIKGAAR